MTGKLSDAAHYPRHREIGEDPSEGPREEERGQARRLMRRVIIVAPHFPPSNLASVHRSRLFATHLREFGWEPVIVTVHSDFYEEALDPQLSALVPQGLRVERVPAIPVKPIRLIGNIGVRGFVPMLKRILKLIDNEPIDFLYITVPSFFAAPLGRIVHAMRGTPYGIDYIDPWVHIWPGSEKFGTKHWVSRKLGEWLEPFSVRKASLITGVADRYFRDVLQRNPHLETRAVTAAMPYGGEKSDHRFVRGARITPYLFDPTDRLQHLVYAGAMLPRAYPVLEQVFRSMTENPKAFEGTRFHFIGTGSSPDDAASYTIKPIAERFGLWGSSVEEHPARIPYLDVLAHLEAADGVFILGSTEAHYTPSKVYQGVLSQKPILAVLHNRSTACQVIRSTRAGLVVSFETAADVEQLSAAFAETFREFRNLMASFDASEVDQEVFEEYSARNVTRQLAEALSRAVSSEGSSTDT